MIILRSIGGVIIILMIGRDVCLASPVSFVTKEVEYRLGESVMIPLETSVAVAETTGLEIKMEKKGVLEIIRQPQILKDQKMGFARIRTLSPGDVVLKCGDASMRVRVKDERPLALMRKLTPRFTSPSSNSSVWGKIHVGAEIWVGAPGVDRTVVPEAKLILPDGRELSATESFPPIDGPFWRLVFELDTSKLPAGDCGLYLSCKPPIAGGKQQMPALLSDEHKINILGEITKGDILIQGECEDFVSTPRAERMGQEAPLLIMDVNAKGKRAVTLRSNRHSWVLQPEIEEDGNYQIMVRARGTLFGSAYASLGIILGENITDAGSVRLSTSSWHRVPVGRPVSLTKGKQWIGIVLANEYRFKNQSLRHADIDSFEIRRVKTAAGAGGGMMMGGMMMQDGDGKGEPKEVRKAQRLQCAFSTILDGEQINGRMDIRASLQSSSLKNDIDYQAIRSDLWINDQYFATSYGRYVSFAVHPHNLKKGENKMFVQSTSPCGNRAISLTQTIMAAATVKKLEVGYDSDRWDMNRGGWDKPKKVGLGKDLATEGAPSVMHVLTENDRKIRFHSHPTALA